MEEEQERVAVSLKNVKKSVWRTLRALAMLNDMELPEYLESIVQEKSKDVQLNQKPE